jgi:hypothetical protein
MNWAHVHLLLNHVPVIGVAFGFFLLLLGVVRKSDELKRASLVVFVVVGALAVPTYLTGEPAEKIVRDLPGVSRALIEQHEDAAMFALISGRPRLSRRGQPWRCWQFHSGPARSWRAPRTWEARSATRKSVPARHARPPSGCSAGLRPACFATHRAALQQGSAEFRPLETLRHFA